MSWYSKTAARLDNILARRTRPPIHDTTPIIAQKNLNYDVLSYIFTLSTSNWKQASLTLASVCRHWRHIALSVPQLWSKIHFGTLAPQNYIEILLARSEPLPLHVRVPIWPNDKQLKALSPATDRIICMKILHGYKFLQNQFPILERLELGTVYGDGRDYQYFSTLSQFHLLRELYIVEASEPMLRAIAAQATGFKGLQKLEIACDSYMHWNTVIQSVSNTLVSLHLFIPFFSIGIPPLVVFPQLRHLQIKKHKVGEIDTSLNIDAPRLESIEEECNLRIMGRYPKIRLRNPRSVKYLRTGRYLDGLNSYPQLQRLWIQNVTTSAPTMIASLRSWIHFCPELKEILYFDSTHYTRMEKDRLQGHETTCLPEIAFSEVCDTVYATGRDIRVREFNPEELNLPGSIPGRNECSGEWE